MNPDLISKYFKKFVNFIPGCLETYDTSRVIILQFSLSGLDLLGRINDILSEEKKRELIEWIYDLQILNAKTGEHEGFRGGYFPSNEAITNKIYMSCHVTMTYSCLVCLLILGDNLSRIDKAGILQSFKKLQNPKDGSFCAALDCPEADVRFIFSALATCAILDDFSSVDVDAVTSFILKCQNYDGGFGQRPQVESHGGSTYCAIASLKILVKLDSLFPENADKRNLMVRWLINRQYEGFHGRPHKADDSCYTFWIGASLKMLGYGHLIDIPPLLSFIESTYDDLVGGFCKLRKTDHSCADPMHTYLCLAGISSLLDECRHDTHHDNSTNIISVAAMNLIDTLQPLEPSLNLCCERSDNLKLNLLKLH